MKRREFLSIASGLSVPFIGGPSSAKNAEVSSGSRQAQDFGAWSLAGSSQKMVFSTDSSGIGFQSFVRSSDGAWVPASHRSNRLIEGQSFVLRGLRGQIPGSASSPRLELHGVGRAKQLKGQLFEYAWDAEVTFLGDMSWFRFDITLELPEPLALQQNARVEPQIILWLTSSSMMMEGQALSWRRVLLDQPTRNSLGASGNDLPALYMLDKNSGVETMMYFDMSVMDWMSLQNLPRFLVYRCTMTSRLEHGNQEKIGVGLVAGQAAGNVMPAGKVRFAYCIRQQYLNELLNERQAVERWMEALLPLFEEKLVWPPCATTWKAYAAGMAQDIQKKDLVRIEVDGHAGLRAYVKETSHLWKENGNNFELMTVADVLWPALLYTRLGAPERFQNVIHSLLKSLPEFYVPALGTISNSFVHGATETVDSWYYFENGLVKYPMIAKLAGSQELVSHFLHAFDFAGTLAHRYDFLFPIYYETGDLHMQGAGTNYAIGGLYAWAGCLAHRITGQAHYLDSARHAIQVLGNVPAGRLFHEPQELAFAALAAAQLDLPDLARYLLYEQLRMFYWYSDPSQKDHDIRGMVQAAASILYPAFKENVESILPWTGIMKRGIVFEALLKFMDQMRRNNFYFFQNCYSRAHEVSLPYIPYENLGTLELGGQTGNVGKEIYGSGEVLWMYLMFEALGKVSDRELMFVNLDLLDILNSEDFPPRELNFILFNPSSISRKAVITIPGAGETPVKITANGEPFLKNYVMAPRTYLRLRAEY